MALATNPQVRARQLANLRPVSRDPELAREMARRHGFGSGKHKRCGATKMDGTPCRGWAMYGTSRCIKHGARRLAGKPSPNRAARAAREWLIGNRPPPDLVRTPEWLATDTMGVTNGLIRKAALVAAWAKAQEGDWTAWRKLTRAYI